MHKLTAWAFWSVLIGLLVFAAACQLQGGAGIRNSFT